MAQAKTEFELKLTGAAVDVAAVRRLDFLQPLAVGEGAWERLASTYFDTPERTLGAAGISLRFRDDPEGVMLTAKLTPPGGSAVCRLEAERLLPAATAEFWTGIPALDAIIAPAAPRLAPIARTATDRWSSLLQIGAARIELSAEIGRAERLVEGAVVAAPIAEVELELMKGDPAALFALARRINDAVDGRLTVSVESKLDKALRAGAAAAIARPGKIKIAEDAVAADVLASALLTAAAQIVAVAPIFVEMHTAQSARSLRVAFRRLRALERAFRGIAQSSRLRALATEARGFARSVGAARDYDVFLSDTLPAAAAAKSLDRQGLSQVRAHVESARAQAWDQAAAALSGVGFGHFSLDLLECAVLQPWRRPDARKLFTPAREFAEAALDRRFSSVLKTGGAVDFQRPESLHALRLDLKKLRYLAQTFRDLYPPADRKPGMQAMGALQSAFGALNDAVVAQAIADEAADGRGAAAARIAGFIAGFRGAQAAATAREIENRWRAFTAREPFWRMRRASE